MVRVVCVGVAVVDTVFAVDHLPLAPGKNFARSVMQVGGGVAANAAATVAALGGEAALWSRVGDDATGEQIVRELAAWRVETAVIQRIVGRTSPVSTVLVDAAGERQIVNHLDAALFATAGDPPRDQLDRADAVLCDPRWPAAAAVALERAHARGIPGVLDVEPVPEGSVPALLARASHVAFSHEGLRWFSASDDVEHGLRRAAERSAAWIGVTCGADGVYWLAGDELHHLPAFAVEVVDTLAAGDVFHGALALALGEGRPIEPALRFASAAAALKCTRFGGREGIPRRAEVERFLGENA